MWPALSAIDGLRYVSDATWLWRPQDWVGVYGILDSISLSLFLALCAAPVGLILRMLIASGSHTLQVPR